MTFLAAVRQLDNPDEKAIGHLIEESLDTSPEQFWKELAGILPQSDWPEKPRVLQALIDRGTSISSPLMKLSRNEDPKLAAEAIDMLVEIGSRDSLDLLDEIRLHRNDDAGCRAVAGLVRLVPATSLPELLEELETAPWDRCRAIHDGLLKRTDRVTDVLVDMIDLQRMSQTYWILRIIGVLGDRAAVAPLISMLEQDCSEDLAFFLCQTLGALQCTRAAEVLIRKLQRTGDWFVQKTIIRILGLLKQPSAAQVLLEYLKSDEWAVSHTAFQSIVPLGESVVDLLLEQLTEDEERLRHLIPKLLGEIASPRAVPALKTEIEREQEPVRLAILIEAAGKIDPEAFYDLLLPFTDADNWMVRYRTFQTLAGILAVRNPGKLRQAANDDNWHVRTAVKLHGATAAAERVLPNN